MHEETESYVIQGAISLIAPILKRSGLFKQRLSLLTRDLKLLLCCCIAPGASRLLELVEVRPVEPYNVLKRRLIQMYSLSDFQRFQALQSLPLLSNQHPYELMDKMLIFLPEEKPGFFL